MVRCSRCRQEVPKGDEYEIVIRPRRSRVEGETHEVAVCRWCGLSTVGDELDIPTAAPVETPADD